MSEEQANLCVLQALKEMGIKSKNVKEAIKKTIERIEKCRAEK